MIETSRPRVLVIDDEQLVADVICSALSDVYNTLQAHDGVTGLSLAASSQPDVILLDINMPQESGLETCEKLRKSPTTRDIPILILTGRDDPETLDSAFGHGADDFIGKPFNIGELKARVGAKIRRIREMKERRDSGNNLLICGNLAINPDRLEVSIEGGVHSLSLLESRILSVFLANQNRIVSRATLLASAWGGVRVSERTVDAHIVSLRKKLRDFDHEIRTVYGAGYVLEPKKVLQGTA